MGLSGWNVSTMLGGGVWVVGCRISIYEYNKMEKYLDEMQREEFFFFFNEHACWLDFC